MLAHAPPNSTHCHERASACTLRRQTKPSAIASPGGTFGRHLRALVPLLLHLVATIHRTSTPTQHARLPWQHLAAIQSVTECKCRVGAKGRGGKERGISLAREAAGGSGGWRAAGSRSGVAVVRTWGSTAGGGVGVVVGGARTTPGTQQAVIQGGGGHAGQRGTCRWQSLQRTGAAPPRQLPRLAGCGCSQRQRARQQRHRRDGQAGGGGGGGGGRARRRHGLWGQRRGLWGRRRLGRRGSHRGGSGLWRGGGHGGGHSGRGGLAAALVPVVGWEGRWGGPCGERARSRGRLFAG